MQDDINKDILGSEIFDKIVSPEMRNLVDNYYANV